jgi:hypothetical protein
MSADVEFATPAKIRGWLVFSGVVTLLVAATNLLFAITLLAKADWIVFTASGLVRFDLRTVGIIYLIFAIFQAFVAFGIFNADLWARVLGIIGAFLNILAHMSFMSVNPQWSWLVIVVDGLVIYGLTVHGDEVAEI